jgi:polyisoprenoid-binding protein YceI
MWAWWARSRRATPVLLLSLALFVATALPQSLAPATPPAQSPLSEIVLSLDPSQSNIHWTVDSALHTVHGTFALKSGTVHFDPETGAAGGEIVVYAPSGQSGNGSRDKRMHKEILETAKYPEVVFRPTHVDGKVDQTGASDVKLSGVFSIHGSDHDLDAPVHTEMMGDHWTATCKFAVPYVKWGIKDPSNFLLRVQPVVSVELELSGAIKGR